ncbi:MAG: hypothetical protein CVU23_02450, partial [Betaproteobacteria bacterium HGW-Betaproteobacteria-17]
SGVLCNQVCYPLNSFENRVYELECEDRSRVVAKFYRPGRWIREQILEEHEFLADLVEAEVPVCPTQRFPDGATLQRIDHIAYCLFQRRGGRAPDELNDELAERLGRLVARIHNAGAARRRTGARTRRCARQQCQPRSGKASGRRGGGELDRRQIQGDAQCTRRARLADALRRGRHCGAARTGEGGTRQCNVRRALENRRARNQAFRLVGALHRQRLCQAAGRECRGLQPDRRPGR